MKIIDLLNKIANGEIKKGTKLKFANDTEIYCFEGQTMTIDVNDLNTEVEIIEEKQQQGRWKPKEDDQFYYINAAGVVTTKFWDNFYDDDNFKFLTKNVFKTEQEAKEYLEYKTALLKAEKPFVEGKGNYFIKLEEGNIEVGFTWASRYVGVICLGQDRDVAQAFIDKWHKQILKYEFGIEE